MRKPRDFDAALKTLTEKTKALKETKRRQLGDLIVATGADALDIDTLAGGLVAMVQTKDIAQKKLWKKQGEEFFRKAEAAQGGSYRPARKLCAGRQPHIIACKPIKQEVIRVSGS